MNIEFPIPRPKRIERTGDDTPAPSLYAYVWRMSGRHQIWISLLAAVVAGLSFAPLEVQRRLVDDAVRGGSARLLALLAGLYLAVVLLQGGLKYALRLYQGWLTESAIRYTRAHLSRIYACRAVDRAGGAEAVREFDEPEEPDAEDDTDGTDGERPSSGRAVSIIGSEVEKIGGFVGEAFVEPLVNIGSVLVVFGYMLVVDAVVALASLAFLVPQMLLTPLVQRHVNRLTEKRVGLIRDLGETIASEPEESILPETDSFRRLLAAIFGNRMRIYAWKFLLKGLVNLSNHLATLGVLFVGGLFVIRGETSVGVIVAFISGFERIADPMRRVLGFYRTAQLAAVEHRMIARFM